MKTTTKCLIAIFLVQIVGFLFQMSVFSNMGHIDMDALSLKDKYFQGEDGVRFMLAVAQASHMERDAHLMGGCWLIAILINGVLALWALIFGRDDTLPNRFASTIGQKPA